MESNHASSGRRVEGHEHEGSCWSISGKQVGPSGRRGRGSGLRRFAPAFILCLCGVAPARGNDFAAAQGWLTQNQPINLDEQCSVLSGGATKLACHLHTYPADALLVGNTGIHVLASEATTIDELRMAGVYVPEHGDIFDLAAFSAKKKLKEKGYPCMLESWIPGTDIENNLRDFNSPQKDFWTTSLGKAAMKQGVGVDALRNQTVPSLQAYLDFINSRSKYVTDVEMFIVGDGTVYLVDLAAGFGNRSSRVQTWKTQLQNAIQSINSLKTGK